MFETIKFSSGSERKGLYCDKSVTINRNDLSINTTNDMKMSSDVVSDSAATNWPV